MPTITDQSPDILGGQGLADIASEHPLHYAAALPDQHNDSLLDSGVRFRGSGVTPYDADQTAEELAPLARLRVEMFNFLTYGFMKDDFSRLLQYSDDPDARMARDEIARADGIRGAVTVTIQHVLKKGYDVTHRLIQDAGNANPRRYAAHRQALETALNEARPYMPKQVKVQEEIPFEQDEKQLKLAEIARQFLLKGFPDRDFQELLMYSTNADVSALYEYFTQDVGNAVNIDNVIKHALAKDVLPSLLLAAADRNPRMYTQFEPQIKKALGQQEADETPSHRYPPRPTVPPTPNTYQQQMKPLAWAPLFSERPVGVEEDPTSAVILGESWIIPYTGTITPPRAELTSFFEIAFKGPTHPVEHAKALTALLLNDGVFDYIRRFGIHENSDLDAVLDAAFLVADGNRQWARFLGLVATLKLPELTAAADRLDITVRPSFVQPNASPRATAAEIPKQETRPSRSELPRVEVRLREEQWTVNPPYAALRQFMRDTFQRSNEPDRDTRSLIRLLIESPAFSELGTRISLNSDMEDVIDKVFVIAEKRVRWQELMAILGRVKPRELWLSQNTLGLVVTEIP